MTFLTALDQGGETVIGSELRSRAAGRITASAALCRHSELVRNLPSVQPNPSAQPSACRTLPATNNGEVDIISTTNCEKHHNQSSEVQLQ